MDSGFYAACTALLARSQAMDTVANNLANSSTPGYRAHKDLFSSILASASGLALTPVNQAINNYGILGGNRLDLSQANLERTGNDLDLGIQGKAFFVVKTPAGEMYTRNGNFHVSADGQLETAEGDLVLGQQGPIPIVGGPVSVAADGTISINGAVAGNIKMVEFPGGTQLESAGKNYYSAPANKAVAATDSRIQQGMLETSNVNPVTGMVDLVAVQRYAELMQRALSMFHTDMNSAAQDIARVSGS